MYTRIGEEVLHLTVLDYGLDKGLDDSRQPRSQGLLLDDFSEWLIPGTQQKSRDRFVQEKSTSFPGSTLTKSGNL